MSRKVPYFLLMAMACSWGAAVDAAEPAGPQAQFEGVVKPFISTYCSDCHNPQKKKGKLSLHDLSGVIVKEKNGDLWATMLDRIESGDMPPEEAKQPDGKIRKAVTDWIRTELGHAGIERDPDLLTRPEFGNLVSHEKLFDGSITTPSFSVPRVWRLRAELVPMGSPFPPTEHDYAAAQTIGEPETLRLRALSELAADQLMDFMLGRKTPNRNKHNNPEAVRVYGIPKLADPSLYTGKLEPSRKMIEADIASLFETFLHRKPTDAEQKRYADFLSGMLATEQDREACLATTMRAVLLTPESIYRLELGQGPALEDGRRMLSEQELAIAVPMSLGSKEPQHDLKSREDVEKAVRKILQWNRSTNGPRATPHGITPRFMDFMHEYFEYDRAPDVFKGDRHEWHAPDKQAARLVEDTDRIVAQILRDDKDVFRRLLTTDQVIVSKRASGEQTAKTLALYRPNWKWARVEIEGGKKVSRNDYLMSRGVFMALSYMAYYGLEYDSPLATGTKENEPIKSPVPRAGILTQPSWLMAHSTFTDNHVVHRGKWVRERLLGGSIPEVPVGVDAAIPDDEDKPLRERLQSTHQDFCWRCHHRMDPLGYPFEMYDDFGRYRADNRERLINGELAAGPVDTSGEVMSSGDAKLDGPVKNAIEMIQRIAESDRARQVFVRHVFRFFIGRNETLDDSQTLIRADHAYVKSGGSFEELVVSILTSDSFLYRKDPPAKASAVDR